MDDADAMDGMATRVREGGYVPSDEIQKTLLNVLIPHSSSRSGMKCVSVFNLVSVNVRSSAIA